MNPVHSVRATLHEGLALASNGRFDEAVSRIEEGLQKAREMGDLRLVALLARNAGIVSQNAGELPKAEAYYQVALQAGPSDPYIYFALGHLYQAMGKLDLAQQRYAQAHAMASENKDEKLLQALSDAGFSKTET